MTTARIRGLLLLLAGGLVFILLGVRAEQTSPVSMVDFKIVYYGTHCLLHQCDPYNDAQLLQVFNREAPHVYAKDAEMYQSVAKYIYFPTVFPFITPFAVMPWQLAHSLWMALTAASFIFAAMLMWQLAAEYAPQMAGGMMALFLMSSGVLLEVGNAAGISISLCVIAAWCFLRNRYAVGGVICLAVSLLIKPQNAGFVWIFLLLAGGMYRKRAWQTLLVAAVIALPTVAWVSHLAPHWPQELHANVTASMTQGAVNDPTPAAVDPRSPGAISISMQTVASVFSRNPKIYSAVTYLLCAPLLFVWMWKVLHTRSSIQQNYFALAAIAVLCMLPVYHRQHDTRLLLLIFPAFAMLWSRRGRIRWIAFGFTAIGIFFTAILPLRLMAIYSYNWLATLPGLAGKILYVLLQRPTTLVLFALGCFYLWAFCSAESTKVPDTASKVEI